MAQALIIGMALFGFVWMAYILYLQEKSDKPCAECWFYEDCDFKGECPRWQEWKGNIKG